MRLSSAATPRLPKNCISSVRDSHPFNFPGGIGPPAAHWKIESIDHRATLALPQRLLITPETSFTASGPVGGPFFDLSHPPSGSSAQTYTLTNSGAESLDWTLAYDASWLDASVTSGTLTPGAPATTVTLSPNSAANNLPLGNYTADVGFTNLNDGSVQNRHYTLLVQAPQTVPIVIAQSTNQSVIEGETVVFTIEVAASSLPVSYNWTRDGVFVTDGGKISGATTGTLIITDVSAADVGNYSVFVANALGAYHGCRGYAGNNPPYFARNRAGHFVFFHRSQRRRQPCQFAGKTSQEVAGENHPPLR